MTGIPRLDKNAALLAGALGGVDILIVAMMGSPTSTTGYLLMTAGLASMAWAAWSRLAAAYF